MSPPPACIRELRRASRALGVATLLIATPVAAVVGQDSAPVPIASRDSEGYVTVRAIALTSPLWVDGVLDEELYANYEPLSDFIQTEPHAGMPATEKTDVWVAFDRARLYVTFRVWESHPERIIAKEMRRDHVNITQSDHVAFLLDTFHDRRNGYQFILAASGGRMDGETTNERQFNGDVNPIYDVRIGHFSGGWTAEIALPFKSFRYGPGPGRTWGFLARRMSRWKNEISFSGPVPDGLGLGGLGRVSAAGTLVGIEPPQSSRKLDIKPFMTVDAASQRTSPSTLSTDGNVEAGVDAKYAVTGSISADFTVNTDFAQVEADEQQINLTRFSLFFPEKRDFFLENQGTFSFGGAGTAAGGGDTPTLFYSRRIGLEAGTLVPLRAGGRLTGRIGGFEFGLLNIQTGAETASQSPSTNFGVVRLKRDVFRRSSVGAILTRRSAMAGRPGASEAYGVDGVFSFGPNLMVNSYWARTDAPAVAGDNTSYRGQFDYNADRYGVQLERMAIGRHFNPDIGFVRRRDMRKSLARLRFSPRPKASKVVRKLSWTATLDHIQDGRGRLETRQIDGDFSIDFQNSDRVLVGVTHTYEFVPAPFAIARGVAIPVGAYEFSTLRAAITFGQHRRASGEVSVEHGEFYNGTNTGFTVRAARVEVVSYLSVEPLVSANWIDVPGHSFTTRVVGSRVTYQVSPWMFSKRPRAVQLHHELPQPPTCASGGNTDRAASCSSSTTISGTRWREAFPT